MTKRKYESEEEFAIRRYRYEKERELKPARIAWKAGYEKMRRAKPERKAARKVWDDRFRKKDTTKRYLLKWTYGITLEDYNSKHKAQEGKCAICGGVNANGRNLSVDHCHTTKVIRDLLCMQCNFMLGNAKDNISILAKAIDYLTKWTQPK